MTRIRSSSEWHRFRAEFVARLGVAGVVALVVLAVAGTWVLAGA